MKTTLTGGPHLSAAGREGAGAARLGPTWAERGKEREKERWAGIGPKTKKGETSNFFN